MLHEESMLCFKTPLASDISGCFMSEFLQGWQNNCVPLFQPDIRGHQVASSLYPCEAKSTLPALWGVLSWVWIEPQRPGALVCNHISPELNPVKSMRALPLASNKVGLGAQWWYRPVKRQMVFWEFSVSSRENSNKSLHLGFTDSLLLLILFPQISGKLKSKRGWQSV